MVETRARARGIPRPAFRAPRAPTSGPLKQGYPCVYTYHFKRKNHRGIKTREQHPYVVSQRHRRKEGRIKKK